MTTQYNIRYIGDTVVRKYGRSSMLESITIMETLCRYLIDHPDPNVVCVYDFKNHGRQRDGTYIYTYDMERLYPLTRPEKKVIQAVADEWYDYLRHASESHRETIIEARTEYPQLLSFLEEVTRAGRYTDLNTGNVMIDMGRDYKLIDLEGFYHAPLDHYKNQWFQCKREVSSPPANSSVL